MVLSLVYWHTDATLANRDVVVPVGATASHLNVALSGDAGAGTWTFTVFTEWCYDWL